MPLPGDTPTHIVRLPEATQSRLRSTQILTSLVQIVSELVQNALDAGAERVDVGLDAKEWMCWVRDDGHGIAKDGLERLATQNGAGGAARYSECGAFSRGAHG